MSDLLDGISLGVGFILIIWGLPLLASLLH